MELTALVGIAVVAFASTNVDDIFVLLGFYADPGFRPRDVVVGQYLGIAALFAISVAVSLVSMMIAAEYLRLLGLAPIFVGAKKLYDLRPGHEASEAELQTHPQGRAGIRSMTVAAVTLANGGDNIGVYAPLFAGKPGYALMVMGLVFAAMTAAWCVGGHWLVKHPTLGAPIRRYGHRVMPFVLIAIGVLILLKSR